MEKKGEYFFVFADLISLKVLIFRLYLNNTKN